MHNPFTRLPAESVIHALKTGLAAVLCYGLTEALHIEFGYWAVISTIIVMQMNVADAIEMGLYRLIGTLIGAVMGIAAILLLPDTMTGNGIALFLTTAACAYLTRWSTRYKMAAITVGIVILASMGQPDRVHFALFRVLEIAIGVACAVVVALAVLPQRAGDALRRNLASQLRAAASDLITLVEAFLARQRPLQQHMLDHLPKDVRRNREQWQKVRRHEAWMFHAGQATLALRVEAIDRAADHMRAMLHSLNHEAGEGFDIIMAPELRALAEATSAMLRHFAGDGTTPPDLREAVAKAEERLAGLRAEGATRRFHLSKLMQFYAFYHALRQLAEDMAKLQEQQADSGTQPL